MSKEDKILEVMHHLGLEKRENGLLTYAVLEKLYNAGVNASKYEEPSEEQIDTLARGIKVFRKRVKCICWETSCFIAFPYAPEIR